MNDGLKVMRSQALALQHTSTEEGLSWEGIVPVAMLATPM